MTIAPGTVVRVLRHPDQHNGSDEGPGVVTHVTHVDDQGVTHARVHVHGADTLPDVHVVDSREQADELLAAHVTHLPRRRGEPDPTRHDVLPWVKVAYPAPDPHARFVDDWLGKHEARLAEVEAKLAKTKPRPAETKSED